jgi:Copper type II ascorbate-dependent monooxygenase, C-terminal domain
LPLLPQKERRAAGPTTLPSLRPTKPIFWPGSPASRQFPASWQIGKPDLIVQIPQPIPVKATGTIPYLEAIVPTGLTEDKWIRSIEIQPTAPEVVHHILVFVEPAIRADDKNRNDDIQSHQSADHLRRGYFAAYVSGNSNLQLPEDSAKLLPAGARLRFQFHFQPNGIATSDQTRLAVVFANQRPQNVIQVKGVVTPHLSIPPEAPNHPQAGFLKVTTDMRLMAFLPHMHLRGKAFRYEALLPNGKTQLLLDVPRYDTNWQLTYRLAEPIDLPQGSVIRATGWYDNSANNPANPDPTRTVPWGPQAEDEMLVGFIEFCTIKPAGAPGKPTKPAGLPKR